MRVSRRYYITVVIVLSFLLALVVWNFSREAILFSEVDKFSRIARSPKIKPDYSDVVIPPNMAPLNFLIQEKAELYFVKISSQNGDDIEVSSRSPKIEIPLKEWKQLLSSNRSENLYIDIYIKTEDSGWKLFDRVENSIANEEIDNYLVYRKIRPGCGPYDQNGIFQRDLRDFSEVPIIQGEKFSKGCVNCHSFCKNNTEIMSIAIRSPKYTSNSMLIEKGNPIRVGTKFGYTSWHPSGKIAAYSANLVRQCFHSAKDEVREVVDIDSAIAYYSVVENAAKTCPVLSQKNRLETYPAWSPDGKYLYFSSAEMLWKNRTKFPPEGYDQVKYDLVRASYDIETDKWGEIETLLSSKETALSILEPRISPDGRWLLFCMCDYGCFPVHQISSDLYLMDLKSPDENGSYEYRKLSVNSDKSESWHSFSSNSRWIAFSSKRDYGVFTRTYFSYIDEKGKASKPIVMPQKDPTFYDSYLKTYSVPELVINPVPTRGPQLVSVVKANSATAVKIPITMATPKPGGKNNPVWNERE